jgi:hypothetical protein
MWPKSAIVAHYRFSRHIIFDGVSWQSVYGSQIDPIWELLEEPIMGQITKEIEKNDLGRRPKTSKGNGVPAGKQKRRVRVQ